MILSVIIFAIASSIASGSRTWIALVDKSVFDLPDPGTVKIVRVESDPFLTKTSFRPTSSPTVTAEPTISPTFPFPTSVPSDGPSGVPTIATSFLPTSTASPTTSSPSSAPSNRTQLDDGNGGCPSAETLYEVVLRDQIGDGWDGRELVIERMGDSSSTKFEQVQVVDTYRFIITRTTMYLDGATQVVVVKYNNRTTPPLEEIIREESSPGMTLTPNPVFKGVLASGAESVRYACLQQGRCYRARIRGGDWAEEVSWEVRRAAVAGKSNIDRNPIVNGGAPSDCKFSVLRDGESMYDMLCPTECHLRGESPLLTYPPSLAPIAKDSLGSIPGKMSDLLAPSSSRKPSSAPSVSYVPSSIPSLTFSQNPTMLPTPLPSHGPSNVPSVTVTESPTTSIPTEAPTKTSIPSETPVVPPTGEPTWSPTAAPSTSLEAVIAARHGGDEVLQIRSEVKRQKVNTPAPSTRAPANYFAEFVEEANIHGDGQLSGVMEEDLNNMN